MKELINYQFNIEIEEVGEKDSIFHFIYQNNSFYLYPFQRSQEELKDIYTICTELKSRNIPVLTFMLNKDGQIITKINDIDYVLLKSDEEENQEYNIIDILSLSNSLKLSQTKSELYRNNWSELWSKKIDYIEYQMRELGKNKKVVLNSVSYFIGLAENAISYASTTALKHKKTDLEQVSLSHKRINFPNYKINYLNPLNFIFDLEVRDVAEYIKSAFFQDKKEAWVELKAFLSIRRLSIYGYQMFYARLIYPSYYFDLYEKIMNSKEDEEKLVLFINKMPEYEIFLKQVYTECTKYAPLEKIDWIFNKKES